MYTSKVLSIEKISFLEKILQLEQILLIFFFLIFIFKSLFLIDFFSVLFTILFRCQLSWCQFRWIFVTEWSLLHHSVFVPF
ncbi:hypothetical protein APZ24_gp132 [Ostreococcus lucimarinus virus 2]|uniref:hypothetical protein n=1 Tax=Ostreococcus lucimarinus virus 2 TaxID=1663208 RepID=UPI0006D06215|nr:hypothetical protein APZ24_gp132 [Ostreococcus lucimarinus virus 2]ALI95495.1 hypothetical protein OlV2_132c [Ostreococcus lucimarinus virus 2]